jgi:hypothetical protein
MGPRPRKRTCARQWLPSRAPLPEEAAQALARGDLRRGSRRRCARPRPGRPTYCVDAASQARRTLMPRRCRCRRARRQGGPAGPGAYRLDRILRSACPVAHGDPGKTVSLRLIERDRRCPAGRSRVARGALRCGRRRRTIAELRHGPQHGGRSKPKWCVGAVRPPAFFAWKRAVRPAPGAASARRARAIDAARRASGNARVGRAGPGF